jgi:hypothetical protein
MLPDNLIWSAQRAACKGFMSVSMLRQTWGLLSPRVSGGICPSRRHDVTSRPQVHL